MILQRVSDVNAGTPNSIPETCDGKFVSASILTKLLFALTICNLFEGLFVPIPTLAPLNVKEL